MFDVRLLRQKPLGKLLIILDAFRGDDENEVRASRNVVALHHFRRGLNGFLEFFHHLWPVRVESHFHDRGKTSSHRIGRNDRHLRLDDFALAQSPQPALHGRRRERDSLSELIRGQATVALDRIEELQVKLVQAAVHCRKYAQFSAEARNFAI